MRELDIHFRVSRGTRRRLIRRSVWNRESWRSGKGLLEDEDLGRCGFIGVFGVRITIIHLFFIIHLSAIQRRLLLA